MPRSIRHLLGVKHGRDFEEGGMTLPLTVGLRLDVDGLPDLGLGMSEDHLAAYQRAAGCFIGVTVTENGQPILVPDLLGLRPLYFSRTCVSDRFLPLVDALQSGRNALKFNVDSVLHFLEYGYPEPGHTLIDSIGRTRPGEALVLRDGCFERVTLNPATLIADQEEAGDGRASRAMIERIGEHLQAILAKIDQPTSADLTGGVDSRILASLATSNPHITEAACSHGDPDALEISLGRAVAGCLGLDYRFTAAPKSMTRDDLLAAFDYVDAHGLLVHAHRHRKMQQERVRRGIEVAIHGEGGAAYKEFWWLQDFPFYRRRQPDIEKLIRLRINPIPLRKELLSDRYQQALPHLRERYRSRLRKLTQGLGNTAAYDQIYYFEKMSSRPVPYVTGGALLGLAVVMPLLNRFDVGRSFGLARRHRVLNYAYRLILSCSRHPEVGSIKTTERTSLRAGLYGIFLDFGPWTLNKIKRLAKKFLQRTLGITMFEGTPNHPGVEIALLQLLSDERILFFMQANGIIHSDIKEFSAFAGPKLPFWGCIGLLAKRMDTNVHRAEAEIASMAAP